MFGDVLKAARIRAGFETAEQFAGIANINAPRYRHWEAGRSEPDLETITRLCILLHITPDELMPEAANQPLRPSLRAMGDMYPHFHEIQRKPKKIK